MYSDDTLLTNGKYKFHALKNVPAEYLITIFENGGGNNPELKKYLANNIDRIRSRGLYQIQGTTLDEVHLICTKRTFPTKKTAMDSIKKDTIGSKKKPIRAYECSKCSGWHLTSKTVNEFKAEVEKHTPKQLH